MSFGYLLLQRHDTQVFALLRIADEDMQKVHDKLDSIYWENIEESDDDDAISSDWIVSTACKTFAELDALQRAENYMDYIVTEEHEFFKGTEVLSSKLVQRILRVKKLEEFEETIEYGIFINTKLAGVLCYGEDYLYENMHDKLHILNKFDIGLK
jgi:hypothetical protein